jgi:hypothetical protein
MNPADHRSFPRREFLWEMGAGFAGVALAGLLDADGFFGSRARGSDVPDVPAASPLLPKAPHHPTRAKSYFLFMFGGPRSWTCSTTSRFQRRDGQTIERVSKDTRTRRSQATAGRLPARATQGSGVRTPCRTSRGMAKLAVVKSLYSGSRTAVRSCR